jgi:prefoldin subunit 5
MDVKKALSDLKSEVEQLTQAENLMIASMERMNKRMEILRSNIETLQGVYLLAHAKKANNL